MKTRSVYNAQIFCAAFLTILGGFFCHGHNLLAGFLCFIVGFLLWRVRVLGGGDVKLMSVLLIGVRNQDLPLFFLAMSISGLLIALLTLVSGSTRGVPYAPAIMTGFLFAFAQNF